MAQKFPTEKEALESINDILTKMLNKGGGVTSTKSSGTVTGADRSNSALSKQEVNRAKVLGKLERQQIAQGKTLNREQAKELSQLRKRARDSRAEDARQARRQAGMETAEDKRHAAMQRRTAAFSKGLKDATGFLIGTNHSFIGAFQTLMEDVGTSLGSGVSLSLGNYWDAMAAGISQQEMLKTQSEYSNVNLKMDQDGSQTFADNLKDASWALSAYTSSTSEAVALQAATLSQAQSLGLDFKDAMTFGDELQTTYKGLNTSVQMTADQFLNLQKSILQNADSNRYMLKLSKEERKTRVRGIFEMDKYFRVQGMSAQAAAEMTQRFDEANRKDTTKDWLKKTIKTQAAMGAMGMTEGAEYTKLSTAQRFGKLDDQGKTRLAQIQGKIGDVSTRMAGSGIAGGLAFDKFNELTSGNMDAMADMSTQLGKSLELDKEALTVAKDGLTILAGWAKSGISVIQSAASSAPGEFVITLAEIGLAPLMLRIGMGIVSAITTVAQAAITGAVLTAGAWLLVGTGTLLTSFFAVSESMGTTEQSLGFFTDLMSKDVDTWGDLTFALSTTGKSFTDWTNAKYQEYTDFVADGKDHISTKVTDIFDDFGFGIDMVADAIDSLNFSIADLAHNKIISTIFGLSDDEQEGATPSSNTSNTSTPTASDTSTAVEPTSLDQTNSNKELIKLLAQSVAIGDAQLKIATATQETNSNTYTEIKKRRREKTGALFG